MEPSTSNHQKLSLSFQNLSLEKDVASASTSTLASASQTSNNYEDFDNSSMASASLNYQPFHNIHQHQNLQTSISNNNMNSLNHRNIEYKNTTEPLFPTVPGVFHSLMVDPSMESHFQYLLHNSQLLESVLLEVFSQQSQKELFIQAAFCKQGSISMVKLIKKIKKEHMMDLACNLTRILSTNVPDMMIHHTARMVIKQCFNLLGNPPNKVLYYYAIYNFLYLATHEVGCISLNECINTISGDERIFLLYQIAQNSDYLSNDPHGNYVVQHVLTLKDKHVNEKIFKCLGGQFVQLSYKKGGSHVVEKCLQASEAGLYYVVRDIIKDPRFLVQLARDQFGNYVIQKALQEMKSWSWFRIYRDIGEALMPHFEELSRSVGGRNVINLLKHDLFHSQGS